METPTAEGETLTVPERRVVAPAVGVFRALPLGDSTNDHAVIAEGTIVDEGQVIGVIEALGTVVPVHSPFRGVVIGMLALPGERLREGQGVAWIRLT